MKKIFLLFGNFYHTIRKLKFIQVFYQVKYRFVKPKRVAIQLKGVFSQVDLIEFPKKPKCLLTKDDNWIFSFLNLEQTFSQDKINWSFGDYGMLWTYNLNYFEWLHQDNISKELGLETLIRFYSSSAKNPIILHPYPTSLRIINIAKFISVWDSNEDWLYYQLVSDLKFLSERLEYHLLANHLLENSFALYIGGLITCQKKIIHKGKKLLICELKKQILMDGMHYERSPMYHLIILERLLDSLNFANSMNDDLKKILKSYAIKMTALAKNWESFNKPPMMQDTTNGIAFAQEEILSYAQRLLGESFPKNSSRLSDSNYRILSLDSLKIVANVGQISPSYQPGHAHADELNFELYYKGVPLIVDTSISTYEKNTRRQLERSTKSHNCLCINNENSSEIWGGFRVARRASVNIEEAENTLSASMKTVKGKRIKRAWNKVDNEFMIHDSVIKFNPTKDQIIGRLHFHPEVNIEVIDSSSLLLNDEIRIISSSAPFSKKRYQYCMGFNNQVESTFVEYKIKNNDPQNIISISIET